VKQILGLGRLGIVGAGFFLATQVFAENGAADLGSGAMAQGLMIAGFVAIFYFLILRPQNKRAKEHRDLIMNLNKGDEIITTGGIVGKISRVTDDFFVIMISENTDVAIQKQAVATVLPKGTLKSI